MAVIEPALGVILLHKHKNDPSLGGPFVLRTGDTMTGALTISLATGNSLIVDTSTLVVDATNNRVGIGLTNPGVDLEIKKSSPNDNVAIRLWNSDDTIAGSNALFNIVAGGASGGDPYFRFQIAGGQSFAVGIDNSDSDKLKISGSTTVGNTDYLTIDTSGNVGIGITAPTSSLHNVGGAAVQLPDVTLSSSATVNSIPANTNITIPSNISTTYTGTVLHLTSPGVILPSSGDMSATGLITETILNLAQGGYNGNNATGGNPVTFTGINITGSDPGNRFRIQTWRGVLITTHNHGGNSVANAATGVGITLGTSNGSSTTTQTGINITGGTQTAGTQRGIIIGMAANTHLGLGVSTGKVGIGTITPAGWLDVWSFNTGNNTPATTSVEIVNDAGSVVADNGAVLRFRSRSRTTGGVEYNSIAAIKQGKTNATNDNLATYMSFWTTDNTTRAPEERWKINDLGDFLAGTDNAYDIGATGATRPKDLYLAGKAVIGGDLDHDGANVGFFGVTPAARASAYTVTNALTDRAYDANATTVEELADVLATLIADLKTYGLTQ